MWTLDILAGRPQVLCFSPLLYSWCSSDTFDSNTIDATAVVGLITKNNVEDLTNWTLEEAIKK